MVGARDQEMTGETLGDSPAVVGPAYPGVPRTTLGTIMG